MRTALLVSTALMFSAAGVSAAEPVYSDDPFGDADFIDPPLILDKAHTTEGRFEVSLLYAGSVVDKYSSHHGLSIEANYHIFETLGLALDFSIYQGLLTSIVTSERGILGIKADACRREGGDACDDINPHVPNYRQITGALDLAFVWSPLYGKINVVSELDVNLQLFALVGGGINGRRMVNAVPEPASQRGYRLENSGFLEGGLFDDLTGHFTAGVGGRIYLTDWLNIRAEYRFMLMGDEFDEDGPGPLEPSSAYFSLLHFARIGVGFVLF